jgi:hypothetical protein
VGVKDFGSTTAKGTTTWQVGLLPDADIVVVCVIAGVEGAKEVVDSAVDSCGLLRELEVGDGGRRVAMLN